MNACDVSNQQCYRVAMVTGPVCVTQYRHIDYVTSVLFKLPCEVTTFLDGGTINKMRVLT
jgi:hypothetical protein